MPGRKLLAFFAAVLAISAAARAATPSTPEEFLGHRVGADRRLAPWPKVVEYLEHLDASSDRVSIESAGTSTLGRNIPVVVVTSAANQRNLDRLREIAGRLADPRGLDPAAIERLVEEGKAVVLVTCTIHSTEVGSTQMAMELVHDLATSEAEATRRVLDDVVLLLMPSINPDGQALVVDWYEKQRGSDFEGGPMPWLYHHYVGHDNNRDFFMLTQKESRAVNDVLYHRWFPQVFLDEHQMGSVGPRMFVPPQADPLAAEVDSLVFRQADLLGTMMSLRLEEAGKTGVGHDMIFDSYWPGGTRNTAWWKGVVGLLTEVASARIATPIYVDPGELRGGVKGLPEYQRRSNFPSPWPGGWWRLRDIVEYELVATRALLETVAAHRVEFLRNRARMARTQVERGAAEAPYAWVVPPADEQHDAVAAAKLVDLLLRHGVEARRLDRDVTSGGRALRAGSTVFPAAQPYRGFLMTMLQAQRYPEVTATVGGEILPPYDVTSWSLPIAMGVTTIELEVPLENAALSEPLRAANWPAADPAPARAEIAGYAVPRAADTAATAVNRALARPNAEVWAGAREFWIPAATLPAAEAARLAGDLALPLRALAARPAEVTTRLRPVRVGLYKPWAASMDEGWTRFLLERYEFPHVTLTNEDLRGGKFSPRVDVLLFPDVEAETIEKGGEGDEDEPSPYPPPYAGGLGKEGGEQIKKWILGGGTAVALDSSSDYLIDLLDLPVTNVLDEVDEKRFGAPGSSVRLLVDVDHPLGHGLRREEAAYFADSPAFSTRIPPARAGAVDRTVVARYPDDERDILVSGYLKGGSLLERRAALVELTVGKGRVILIGFRAQHRAQTHATFKLLWNALWRAGLIEESPSR